MVTVPTIRERRVELRNIPRTGVLPTGDIAAFGGGRAAAGPLQALRQSAQATLKFAAREKLKADEVQTLEGRNALAKLENELTWGENGLFKTQGKNAIGGVDRTREAWIKGTSEIEATMTNARQKEAFRRMVAGREPDLFRAALKHVAVEGQRHEDNTFGAFMANIDNRIALNPTDQPNVKSAIEEKRIELLKWAARSGMGREETKRFEDSEISKSHSIMISTLLNRKQYSLAQQWFEDNNREMTGEDKERIRPLLQRGSTLGELQKAEDGLIGQIGAFDSLVEAEKNLLERARQTGPPEFRDELVSRLKPRFAELKRQEAEQYDNFLNDTMKKVIANPTSFDDAVPLTEQDRLRAKDLQNLKAVFARVKSPTMKSSPTAKALFWTQKTPRERAEMKMSEILGGRALLDDTDYDAMLREIDRSKKAIQRGEVRNLFQHEINSMLRRVFPPISTIPGKVAKAKQSDIEADIRSEFADAVALLPAEEQTVAKQRDIMRDILTDHVKVRIDKDWSPWDEIKTNEELQGDYSGAWVLEDQHQRALDSIRATSTELQTAPPPAAVMNERMNRAFVALRVGESDKTILKILEGKIRWPEQQEETGETDEPNR